MGGYFCEVLTKKAIQSSSGFGGGEWGRFFLSGIRPPADSKGPPTFLWGKSN